MAHVVRIPSSGYITFNNFVVRRDFTAAYNIVPNLVAASDDPANIFNVANDENNDKVLQPGTLIATYLTTGQSVSNESAFPLSEEAVTAYGTSVVRAVGFLVEQLNLRNGDRNGGVMVEGWVREKTVLYDGELGKAIPSGVKNQISDIKFDNRMTILGR